MSYKILEQNGVENEVVDGGALNNFCAGNRDGIIAGVLSECALAAVGNGVSISPGLLIICGVRIKITAAEMLYVSSVPLRATRYQIIAQVTLGADGNISAEFFLQSNASLKRDAIYVQGYGTYQAEIGSFTHNPDGSISDLVRTLDVISSGGVGSVNIEVGNVVTNTLAAGLNAEVDVTVRQQGDKAVLDFTMQIPQGASGTDEEAVHFTPQDLTDEQKQSARSNIGLDNVDNTADKDKPVSTAQAVAINAAMAATKYMGFCSSAASNAAKVVNIPNLSANSIAAGTRIVVKFTYANTSVTPHLNVSGSGAKLIKSSSYKNLSGIDGDWDAGCSIMFCYDGTCWVMLSATKAEKFMASHPVDSLFETFSDLDPAEVYGGDWEKIQGRVIFGAGSGYALGSTGGEANVTLTVEQMPSHNHQLKDDDTGNWIGRGNGAQAPGTKVENTSQQSNIGGLWSTYYVGGSQPHNNMPPYIVANIWRRTA